MIYLIIGVILLFSLPLIFWECSLLKLRRRLKRNNEVAKFRQFILFKHTDLYEHLPTYDEMLNSNNPLTIDYYFPDLKNNI